ALCGPWRVGVHRTSVHRVCPDFARRQIDCCRLGHPPYRPFRGAVGDRTWSRSALDDTEPLVASAELGTVAGALLLSPAGMSRSAAMAASSLRRWPIEVTPRQIKFSAVRWLINRSGS